MEKSRKKMNTTLSEHTEQLLRSKDFDLLSAAERESVLAEMSEEDYDYSRRMQKNFGRKPEDELTVPPTLKAKLDRRLTCKQRSARVWQIRIPVYQSVAAAVLLFFIGMHFNRPIELPQRVVTQKVAVLKYVDRPVKEIRYVPIRQSATEPVDNTRVDKELIAPQPLVDKNEKKRESFDARATTLPDMANNTATNTSETVGISMGSDTVLRSMMVTIY